MSRASADPCWEHSQPRPSVLGWQQLVDYSETVVSVSLLQRAQGGRFQPPPPDFSFSISSDRDGTQGSLMLDWVAVRTGEHTE